MGRWCLVENMVSGSLLVTGYVRTLGHGQALDRNKGRLSEALDRERVED